MEGIEEDLIGIRILKTGWEWLRFKDLQKIDYDIVTITEYIQSEFLKLLYFYITKNYYSECINYIVVRNMAQYRTL